MGEECQELPERLECGPTLRNSRRGPVEQQPLAPGRPEVAEGGRPARQHQIGETGLDQAQHEAELPNLGGVGGEREGFCREVGPTNRPAPNEGFGQLGESREIAFGPRRG